MKPWFDCALGSGLVPLQSPDWASQAHGPPSIFCCSLLPPPTRTMLCCFFCLGFSTQCPPFTPLCWLKPRCLWDLLSTVKSQSLNFKPFNPAHLWNPPVDVWSFHQNEGLRYLEWKCDLSQPVWMTMHESMNQYEKERDFFKHVRAMWRPALGLLVWGQI